MGKTKTAFVTGLPAEEKSGKVKYEERKKQKAEKEKEKVRVPGLGGGQRVVAVGAEAVPQEEAKVEEEVKAEVKKPKVRSKKYKDALAKVDKSKSYSLSEAVKLVKETSYSKFDGSVELHLLVKKEKLTAQVSLPYSSGKQKRIEIADSKTFNKLKKGKIDFDLLLATSDMMPKLVPFAKLLGPKGLMPNPKNGTLIKSAKEADKFKGNTLMLKTEKKSPLVHTVIGKVSQAENELIDNAEAIIDAVNRKLIEKAHLAPTMGPSVKIQI